MKWIALACGLSLLPVRAETTPPDPEEAAYPAIQRFVQVLETVRKRHPDLDKLAYDRLVNHALEGMLAGLDPHSSFIHPEMMRQMAEHPELNAESPSLGITLGLRDDGPYIAALAPQGPAAVAGILPGSLILEIDGLAVVGTPMEQLPLARPAGETTRIKFKSPAAPQAIEITLIHRQVDERSVVEAKMWDPEKAIGYLRLASFGKSSAREMEAALDELEDRGMKSLMLDLRGNGGGSLSETVKILGLFLPPSTAVVTTRGRDGQTGDALKTPSRQRRKRDYPVAVLIDRMSASASELTAGALQDLKRATVVGEVSYGKGSVQEIIPMGGGTALRLTIATYHTPSGNTPHRKGITPDRAVPMDETQREKLAKRFRLASLSPEQRAEIDAWQDPVMAAAIEALGGE